MTGVAIPMAVVEAVPESCVISSTVIPLPEGVLLTPVNQKVFEGVPRTSNEAVITPDNNQIEMETSPLVEHISYENIPMDTDKTPKIKKRMITPNSNKQHIPTIFLPINPASKAENLQISAQAMYFLKNTNIQVSWAEFCKVSPQF
ncbi:hypothetical protein DSO57_1003121 [Entomophthora muscae]|uniref:Uncharacterized protein n=1 Tax=Entomophthora muscae TaxID=34485 RepID=A0ACC2UU77_9FUNG|nr:hypothetical protein DSO57_1003121 [Entomophthora muscae]